ncbi:hypothetical protein BB559_003012 [Furculomyces boomerangus]|uniref:PiggyBac transposable element-derived protein domain-containing protein n=1 Tax=Furculomyces boomerangus TaxID=61424 RepID=A0A2T9YQ08_9FUNG|nr:hypothetical protein BB559_003012 [Furculomyces boomerangus]
MLIPFKEGIAAQWSKESSPIKPSENFGIWMSRDEFRIVAKFLSFQDTQAGCVNKDRHFRLRKIVDTLNSTFAEFHTLGSSLQQILYKRQTISNVYKIGTFAIGTIIPKRKKFLGSSVIDSKMDKIMEHGDILMQQHNMELEKGNKECKMVSVSWKNTKPVHLLSTGVSNYLASVKRKKSNRGTGNRQSCNIITTYHKNVGRLIIITF